METEEIDTCAWKAFARNNKTSSHPIGNSASHSNSNRVYFLEATDSSPQIATISVFRPWFLKLCWLEGFLFNNQLGSTDTLFASVRYGVGMATWTTWLGYVPETPLHVLDLFVNFLSWTCIGTAWTKWEHRGHGMGNLQTLLVHKT